MEGKLTEGLLYDEVTEMVEEADTDTLLLSAVLRDDGVLGLDDVIDVGTLVLLVLVISLVLRVIGVVVGISDVFIDLSVAGITVSSSDAEELV